jgi:hypothetical protein
VSLNTETLQTQAFIGRYPIIIEDARSEKLYQIPEGRLPATEATEGAVHRGIASSWTLRRSTS